MSDCDIDSLVSEVIAGVEISASSEQKRLLTDYVSILAEWNKKINLVSRKRFWESVADRMFDALLLWREFRPWNGSVHLDIGSGGGLPAIPIHIMAPTEQLVVVEARRQRAGFLSAVIAHLNLNNVKVCCERFDERGAHSILGGPFDVVTAQAVKPVAEMMPLIVGRLGPGGRFIWIASRRVAHEILDASHSRKLSLKVTEREFRRPDGAECWIGSLEQTT